MAYRNGWIARKAALHYEVRSMTAVVAITPNNFLHPVLARTDVGFGKLPEDAPIGPWKTWCGNDNP